MTEHTQRDTPMLSGPAANASLATARPDIPVQAVIPLAVSLDEAGQVLGVSAQTVLREIQRGQIKAFKIGRQWRIRIVEVNAYMKRLETQYSSRS